MKTMIQASNLLCGIAFPVLSLATGSLGYDVAAPLKIAIGRIDNPHPRHPLPARPKPRTTPVARIARLPLALLRYGLLVLALAAAAWLLTCLLLHTIDHALAPGPQPGPFSSSLCRINW
jgi:hypothetical protein